MENADIDDPPIHHSTNRRCVMPKYLIQANYTADGAKGVLKEGGSKRRSAVQEMVQSLGGKVDAFYYAFGETDVYLIIDLPDAVSCTGLALTINSSGMVGIKTTVLVTPEEVDQAIKKSFRYRAPGQ